MKADLHLHTTASDGSLSPEKTMEYVKSKGIDAVAITDHDTIAGIAEGRAAAEKLGMKFVAGIELSAVSSCEIHILGYGMDMENQDFLNELEEVQRMRTERNLKIGEKLKALGVCPDIDFSAAGLGRMNIARAMLACGFVKDINTAFERYLGSNTGAAYCSAKRLTPVRAVEIIKEYGGISAIAHPKKFLADKRLEMIISGLKPYGLGGLEVNYPGHTDKDREALGHMADKYRLIHTGGSDFHGDEDKNFEFEPSERTLKALKI